jgi:hypothetical protein
VKAFAVARNVPLAEPAGTATVAGTVRLVELELRPMVPPPDPLRVTVAVTATASPDAEAPILLLIVIGTSPLPDWVSDRVATNPSEMVLEFKPQATH